MSSRTPLPAINPSSWNGYGAPGFLKDYSLHRSSDHLYADSSLHDMGGIHVRNDSSTGNSCLEQACQATTYMNGVVSDLSYTSFPELSVNGAHDSVATTYPAQYMVPKPNDLLGALGSSYRATNVVPVPAVTVCSVSTHANNIRWTTADLRRRGPLGTTITRLPSPMRLKESDLWSTRAYFHYLRPRGTHRTI
jgi:hypothetical protein